MVYAVSDIHGHLREFESALEKVGFGDGDFLYVLGDAIDRGPDSLGVVKKIRQMENAALLKGNHEALAEEYLRAALKWAEKTGAPLDRYSNPRLPWEWACNGGMLTFAQLYHLPTEEVEDFLGYLEGLPLVGLIKEGEREYVLTHSGPYKGEKDEGFVYSKSLSLREAEDLVWSSPFREDEYAPVEEYPEGKTSVFGHVPVARIGKDKCFCFQSGGRVLLDIDGGMALNSPFVSKLTVANLTEFDVETVEMEL